MGKSSLPQPSSALGHCPAERWTRFRSDIWQTRTVVTTSHYDWYSSLTSTSWSTNIRLVKCQPLVTRRLMPSLPSVTVNCVCRRYVLTSFFFLDWCTHSWSFWVATVNVFLSVNQMMFTSLGEYFSKTVLNGWVLHASLLHSALGHGEMFHKVVCQHNCNVVGYLIILLPKIYC